MAGKAGSPIGTRAAEGTIWDRAYTRATELNNVDIFHGKEHVADLFELAEGMGAPGARRAAWLLRRKPTPWQLLSQALRRRLSPLLAQATQDPE